MFSTFFINRPIFATVLSILIVIAGLVSLRGLPVEQYPTITPPTVVVRASYPGANASTIADMVGTPIEQQVNGVEGMLYMSSTSSSTGSYQLTITFEVGTDLDMATVLVENRVNMALSTLPQEVTQIGVTTTKESTNVVMFLSLTSDSPQYDALFLSNYAALNITNELGRVKGVGNVGLFGMGKYSMRIWLDPDQLTIRGITPADIVSAIQGQNIQVTAGSVGSEPLVRKEAYQYTLETKGLLIDEEEFGNIIVKALPDGKYLRIRDLATIELGRESYSSTATLKGGAVAAIAVYQLPGANALDVAQRVKKEMDKLASYFPEGVQYSVTLDTTEFINASISGIYETLITAFILVLLVILIFLQNWRAMLIPLITIPVSLVGTFTFMAMLGFSINTLTLFGLVLAIGLVVDDAIIIVENSYRLIETGRYPTVKEAVIQAMKEVSGAVVGIVLVLLAVFIPTAFIGGITGQLYKQFALTIAISTVISGFNALTLSPALCALFLKPKQPAKFFLFKAFNRFFEKTNHGYTWVITHFMRKSLMTFIVFLILSVLAFWGFIKWPRTFIPEEDQGYFIAFMQLTDGASSSQTATALQKASAVLNQSHAGGYQQLRPARTATHDRRTDARRQRDPGSLYRPVDVQRQCTPVLPEYRPEQSRADADSAKRGVQYDRHIPRFHLCQQFCEIRPHLPGEGRGCPRQPGSGNRPTPIECPQLQGRHDSPFGLYYYRDADRRREPDEIQHLRIRPDLGCRSRRL